MAVSDGMNGIIGISSSSPVKKRPRDYVNSDMESSNNYNNDEMSLDLSLSLSLSLLPSSATQQLGSLSLRSSPENQAITNRNPTQEDETRLTSLDRHESPCKIQKVSRGTDIGDPASLQVHPQEQNGMDIDCHMMLKVTIPALLEEKDPVPVQGTTSAPSKHRPSGSGKPIVQVEQHKQNTSTKESKVHGCRWDPTQQVAFLRSLPGNKPLPIHEVSTDLTLFIALPWKIKKKLNKTDIDGHHSRLLLPKEDVRIHILPKMSDEMVSMIASKQGMTLTVVDWETDSEHPLVLKYWWTIGAFVLNGQWTDMFVNRRGLRDGDEIGLFWCNFQQKLYFQVLARHE